MTQVPQRPRMKRPDVRARGASRGIQHKRTSRTVLEPSTIHPRWTKNGKNLGKNYFWRCEFGKSGIFLKLQETWARGVRRKKTNPLKTCSRRLKMEKCFLKESGECDIEIDKSLRRIFSKAQFF